MNVVSPLGHIPPPALRPEERSKAAHFGIPVSAARTPREVGDLA
jgi:hypothetical protein